MKQSSTSRRGFISTSAKASLLTVFSAPAIGAMLSSFSTKEAAAKTLLPSSSPQKTGFDQTPLPFPYNALEPYIDAPTMDIHYNKHAAAYSKNLKEAALAEKVAATASVEDVLANVSKYSMKMRNNAGGHYNHELFWKCLAPNNGNAYPTGKFMDAINSNFGSLDGMKTKFSEAAKTRFGSGWAWVLAMPDKKLVIASTPNQDNSLMDIADIKGYPLFGLDVWEHAYYLKYQNRRADYIDSFWKIINWDFVQKRFEM